MNTARADLKASVHDFWNQASCGEVYAGESADPRAQYVAQARSRYALEPYIVEFADFPSVRGLDVLEIGVGMGADHQRFAEAGPRSLTGIDLTERAIEHTRSRFGTFGLTSDLQVADAERLPFGDGSFDLVYSWGVIHHSPDTQRAVDEIRRVLRPGGRARVMIYHRWSIVGLLLWLRYAALKGRPFRGLDWVYHHYLESPGTKAYSVAEARTMFSAFRSVEARAIMSFGDLLEGEVGQRHGGLMLRAAKKMWPRKTLGRLLAGRNFGLYLLIIAQK